MRDNLIFSGITEKRHKDTGAALQEFLQKSINWITKYHSKGSIEWVNGSSSQHRNNIAKFTYFKEREFIRTCALQKLHKSNVWVYK